MAGYLLDTIVLSELLKKRPEPAAHGLVVATRNAAHFSRVKTLRVINWWPA